MFSAGRAPLVVLALLGALIALLVPAGSVAAHTDFESSDPADGDVVDAPVEQVVITFTSAAEPAGDGFRALDASGELRTPTEVVDLDDRTFELRFDPPLAGGQVGVSWQVRAGDAHPINGAFSFTVTAPAPSIAPSTSAAPTTSAPGTGSTDTVPENEAAASTTSDPVPGTSIAASATDDASAPPTTLEEFLADSSHNGSDTVGRLGRSLTLLAVAVGLGVLAFTAMTLRGTRREIAGAVVAVQLAGAAVAIGAVVELIGLASSTGDSVGDALATSAGTATVLRFVGGVALAVGLLAARSAIVESPRRALSAAVVDVERTTTGQASPATWRWVADRRAGFALAGATAIVVSFWFDGHTVTEGWRPLHALVDSVHVVAGSVWVGGVATMAALLWSRRRAGRPSGAADLVVRFSPIATVALIGVAAAGAVMAVMILDSPGDLFSTEWGQVLVLKTVAVAVAAAIGGYNHFRLRPMLDATPGDAAIADRLRTSVTVEAIVLLFVVVTTASLVAAATT